LSPASSTHCSCFCHAQPWGEEEGGRKEGRKETRKERSMERRKERRERKGEGEKNEEGPELAYFRILPPYAFAPIVFRDVVLIMPVAVPP
jgi:hypothetical protein